METGKTGFSKGGSDGLFDPCRNFMLGENNLMTSGHTLSLRRKLNSGCYKNKITIAVIPYSPKKITMNTKPSVIYYDR
jgi:hypothetical protein